jgi:HK97 family phage portal protein
VLARAPQVLRAALGIQEFTASLWDNAATPSGAISSPLAMNDDAKSYLERKLSEKYQGARRAGTVLILDEGMRWEQLAISPENAEVLASRRFTGEEIARLFNVPPPIMGDFQFGSFTNAETAGRWHSSLCLANWCRKIEAEFQRSLFVDDDFHMMLDLSGLR